MFEENETDGLEINPIIERYYRGYGDEMRNGRFRYRAWDKINKIMYTGLPYNGAGKTGKDMMDMVLKHPQIYILMESTGVYADGVLVFEGDYLSDGHTIWEVIYCENMSGFSAKAICGFGGVVFGSDLFSLYHLCNGHNAGRKVSIVGNKYEYIGPLSELLKIEV